MLLKLCKPHPATVQLGTYMHALPKSHSVDIFDQFWSQAPNTDHLQYPYVTLEWLI